MGLFYQIELLELREMEAKKSVHFIGLVLLLALSIKELPLYFFPLTDNL
jgi:hypothetical protein